jgi:AAA+ ATPase superfamily predicted ATPase
MKNNPFKFGSIVDEPYFTNRKEEIARVTSILNSQNHLVIISPRRFGKSSLVFKVVSQLERPVIALDLQLVTGPADLAAQMLKRIYRVYPFEKVRRFVRNFRVIPTISVNPVTNEVDISFIPSSTDLPVIEDVLNLVEKLASEKRRAIVVFDEFQELPNIGPELLKQFRSVMQHHKRVNYVFLGSQESLIRSIFEKKRSPFYHFGILFPLDKINRDDFGHYLVSRLQGVTQDPESLSEKILGFTGGHPYYTQQLAFFVWEILMRGRRPGDPVERAIEELIRIRDIDYERIWNSLNKTDRKLLIGLVTSGLSPLTDAFIRQTGIGATSTVFSSLKRLSQDGFLIRSSPGYSLDDPFFRRWIMMRRER